MTDDQKTHAIDALLPQTQCGECGYGGCLPYAKELSEGNTSIDRCPPGGVKTLQALGTFLNIDPKPYMPKLAHNMRHPAIASIRESECIGCTKCIQACPVDAIIGTAKMMHAILAHECTGCGLCVDPCPMDCIDIYPQKEATYDRGLARQRFQARKQRLSHEKPPNVLHNQEKKDTADVKKAYILEAITRVQLKKMKNK